MKVTFWLISLPALIALSLKGGIYLYAHFSRTHNLLTRLYLLTLFGFSIQNIAEVAGFYTFLERGAMPNFEANVFYAALIAAYAFLFHLVLALAFDPQNKTVRQFVTAIYLYAVALEVLLFFTPWLIVGYTPIRQYTVTKIPGPLYWALEGYFIGICLSTVAILAYGVRRQLSPYRRSQIKLVLLAIIPINLLLTVVLVTLHVGVRLFNATVTMPIALTFFLLTTAYATHQYRLFDIEFFLPWSKVRKRKTLFYQRIRAVIAEIAQMPSAQKALQAVSDLFHCQVALVGGGRSLAAVPASVGFTNATIDHFNADTFPREALDKIDHIVVAHEIAERNPALHQLMRRHGLGAVVPFKLPRAIGHQWLVLGDQFSEQVHTRIDFKRVEALFARIADCFLDDCLSLRSSFAAAIERNDAEWQQRVQRKQHELRESEKTVARLESEIHRLREEATGPRWRSPQALDLVPPSPAKKRDRSFYAAGHSRIISTGVYIPEQRVTSCELFQAFDSRERFGIPYDWLDRTMGIKERRMAPAEMLPSDMAIIAAREALERAKITPVEIDVIIFAGVFRDYIEPASAHRVQHELGAKNAIVFDVTNACHGFMNGIHLVDALIALGQVRYGLVVAGEQSSQAVRRAIKILQTTHDREVFKNLAGGLTLGDAGAAMILGPKIHREAGFMGFMLRSLGAHSGLCTYGTQGDEAMLVMTDMPNITKAHLQMHAEIYEESMLKLGWEPKQIRKFVHHQVSVKAFKTHAQYSKVPTDLMPNTISTMGNLVTASIPVNLHKLSASRQMTEGDKVFIAGAGSGLSISQGGFVWEQTR
jgi:3-oxoacyl-(acyl-carrier-protein) synthase III